MLNIQLQSDVMCGLLLEIAVSFVAEAQVKLTPFWRVIWRDMLFHFRKQNGLISSACLQATKRLIKNLWLLSRCSCNGIYIIYRRYNCLVFKGKRVYTLLCWTVDRQGWELSTYSWLNFTLARRKTFSFQTRLIQTRRIEAFHRIISFNKIISSITNCRFIILHKISFKVSTLMLNKRELQSS